MFSYLRQRSKSRSIRKPATKRLAFESLEIRTVMSGLSVVNLNDSGAGSLRQAILDANASIGADTIDFDIAGTISLKSALPKITDQVDIDGTTAPGFAGTPLIEIDFNAKTGLLFELGSDGSALRSIGLVDAAASGVKLNGAGSMVIVGNYIGVDLDGSTVEGNRKNGIELANSNNNTIGGDEAAERNVISGNKDNGIYLSVSSINTIVGNYIGTDKTGTLDRGNVHSGIIVTDASQDNVIGGTTANLISGNNANGVYLKGGSMRTTVSGNIIGLNAAGTAALGNSLDGVKIEGANGNLIGQEDPTTSVDYYTTTDVSVPVNGWQGLRGGDSTGQYQIAGTSGANGLLYVGDIEATTGTPYTFQYPNQNGNTTYNTSAYGSNNLGGGNVQVVGSYKNTDYAVAPVEVNGFLYEGPVSNPGFLDVNNYRTINFQGAKYNYVHSTSGGLVVGNYDSPTDPGDQSLPLGPGHAFIYDIDSQHFIEDIHAPNSVSNSAYGIWYNGGTSYTIVGGYSTSPVNNFDDQSRPLGLAYMVDYDSDSGQFSNWASFEYPFADDVVTHFEGISSVEPGVYTVNAQSAVASTGDPLPGSWITVRRKADGTFSADQWVNLNYVDPVSGEPVDGITTSDSVFGNQVVGIVLSDDPTIAYQATINTGFHASNIISGNLGNGIEITGASNNRVARNYIGTDITGLQDLGNAQNGVLITNSSTGNKIGGEFSSGNDPLNGDFVQPGRGNVISGNNANGVLISNKSTGNQLSGNFIGTNATGNAAMGNGQDGVAIVKSNANSLVGATSYQASFAYYNVLSGNLGNGLRISDSNSTQIQSNFFGIGANNSTAIGNVANGILVEGSSSETMLGGAVGLGNVVSGNLQNGVVVQGKASTFVAMNNTVGLAAEGDTGGFGNQLDGFLITSTGGFNSLIDNVISANLDDGVEISGSAKDVTVTGNTIGLDFEGQTVLGNQSNGVEVGGKATSIVIGGPDQYYNQPTNTISGNLGNGVAIVSKANNVTVNNSFIGTDFTGTQTGYGNGQNGVLIAQGTKSNTIGSRNIAQATVISGNHGSGVFMVGTSKNIVIGAHIGTDLTDSIVFGNDENGVTIGENSNNNQIGGTREGEGNTISYNGQSGVYIQSGTGNLISGNSIDGNTALGIWLDDGANKNQAAPSLGSFNLLNNIVTVSGTLTSKPKTSYSLEFFASPHDDASGKFYLGKLTVKTNSAGVATFEFVSEVPAGNYFITATATDPDNNTSQFSVSAHP